MSRHSIVIWFFAAAALFTVACGGSANKSGKLENSADSLSYVVGMNIAYNIMNMDTTMRAEAIIAGKADDQTDTIYEIADLAYHVMVLMLQMGISLEDVHKELASRHIIDHKVKQEKMTK